MRALRALRARHDMVEVLLRRGRLADVPMLNFFSSQLEQQATTPNTTTTAPPSSAAEEGQEKGAEKATRANSFRAQLERVQALARTHEPTAWLGEVYGRQRWSTSYLASRTTSAHHTNKAQGGGAAAWQLSGTATAAGGAYTVAQTNTTTAAAAEGGEEKDKAAAHEDSSHSNDDGLPETIQVIASVKDSAAQHTAECTPGSKEDIHVVAASVPLRQRGVTYERHNGVLHLKLHEAAATLLPAVNPYNVAVTQHVMTAAAYAAILGRLEEICALHATHAVRYDALLIRNPATQRRLAQLACFRFGIESLLAYVVSDAVGEEKTTQAMTRDANKQEGGGETRKKNEDNRTVDGEVQPGRLNIPLLESVVLNLYAESALMDGMDDAWAMVHEAAFAFPAQPHRSLPGKVIDYPYLKALLQSPKYVLTSIDGTTKEQALHFLMPLLQPQRGGTTTITSAKTMKGSMSTLQYSNNNNNNNNNKDEGDGLMGGLRGLFSRWLGMSSGRAVRLTAPHPNLRVATAGLERDLAALLEMVRQNPQHSSQAEGLRAGEPSYAIAMAQYVAELLTNVAVVCRCTAALNADEEGKGHREWLLTQAFCAASSLRRRQIMDEVQSTQAASRILHRAVDLDSYSVHPVELMNAAPAKPSKAEASKAAEAGTKTTAQAQTAAAAKKAS